MDSERFKRSAEWFYRRVFGDENIPQRVRENKGFLPPMLRAARSLQDSMSSHWQTREALFVKQGKLLANYEDDYTYEYPVIHYFPTYHSLSDPELRGYFSWRSKLRRGEWVKTHATYAYLYIYELLNLVTVTDAMEGFAKLTEFRDRYGELDSSILHYMNNWITDFVIYYDLDPALLADSLQVRYDCQMAVFADIEHSEPERIMEAVHVLAPRWLKRSKFYADHRDDMDQVIPAVLRRMELHYSRGKRPLVQQFFGTPRHYPVHLMASAVFCYGDSPDREYVLDPVCVYRCQDKMWTVKRYPQVGPCAMLEDVVKAIDAEMRRLYDYGHPIKCNISYQWLLKVIHEEVQSLLERKKAAEARTLRIDYTILEDIRQKAAVTRDALLVEEELLDEEEDPQESEQIPEPVEMLPLPPDEYRLMQCLLYGRDLSWVHGSGLMLSVLTDSVNDLLFDTFGDTVLEPEEPPLVIEDYRSDLKEMILP